MLKEIKILSACLLFMFSFSAKAQTLSEALRLTDNEQYDVADGAYQALIAKEPTNGTYWFYYGENFWKWENPDSAKICYQKGLMAEAANPLNLVGIGKTLLEQNNTTEAKNNFDKALLAAGSKAALVQMEVAEAYIISAKNKNINYALELLQKAAASDVKNPEIYVLIGDAYTEKNDGSLAAENYNKALDINKQMAKAIVKKGVLYKRSTNYEGAQTEFENAIAIDPMFAPAHRELGEIYFRLRKMEKAKEEYRKYLDLSKNTSNARLRYASFLFSSKDYSGTLNEINQLNKLDADNISLLRLYAYTYAELGDSTKAMENISKVFQKVEETKRTQRDYEYYAKILAKNGQDSLGVVNLERAYAMDSTNTDMLIDIGTTYMKMKRYPEAANAFQKRVDMGKSITSTDYFNLGRAYSSAKDYTRADSSFAKVNELLPKWPNGFLWRAQVNANIDSTSEKGLAKPFYDKFIETSVADSANASKYKNGTVEAYRYLGYYYFNQKQIRESKEYWNKVLDLIPGDKQATDVLNALNQPKKENK